MLLATNQKNRNDYYIYICFFYTKIILKNVLIVYTEKDESGSGNCVSGCL